MLPVENMDINIFIFLVIINYIFVEDKYEETKSYS